MKKSSSIIDYPKSGLDLSIWVPKGADSFVFKDDLKEQVLSKLFRYFDESGFKHPKEWIKRIKLIGSLTSYQWRNDSDLDVHSEVDVDKFIKLEFDDSIDAEDAKKLLDEVGRKDLNVDEMEKLSGTNHPIEYFFELYHKGKMMEGQAVIEYDGVYDLLKNKWIKPPREVHSAFDPEEIYAKIFEAAEDIAEEFDIKLGVIKRNILDIKFINEALGSFKERGSIEVYKKAIDRKLAKIEEEIKDYMIEMKDIIQKRKKLKSQYDDENLRFKFLAKFSYVWLEKQLEKILGEPAEITEEKLPAVEKAIEEQWTRNSKLKLSKKD